MSKYISTQEIIEKGKEINRLHKEYKDSDFNLKLKKEYDIALEDYRREVDLYIRTNPADISKAL